MIRKDGAVIQRDAPWQACREESASEHPLRSGKRRSGRLQTGGALTFEAADHIDTSDETHMAHVGHLHAALGIPFPRVVWCAL